MKFKKIISGTMALAMTLILVNGQNTKVKAVSTNNNYSVEDRLVSLDFIPQDTILNDDKSYLFTINKEQKKLYKINVKTGQIQEKQLQLKPQKLCIKNNKLYVGMNVVDETLQGDVNTKSLVQKLDLETLEEMQTLKFDMEIKDLDVDSNEIIYLNSEYLLKNYDGKTGKLISTTSTKMLALNEKHKKTFTITYDYKYGEGYKGKLRYDEIGKWNILIYRKNIECEENKDLINDIRFSPDEDYIFNGEGKVFKILDDTASLNYIGNLGKSFSDITFDLSDNIYVGDLSGNINGYRKDGFNEFASGKVNGSIKNIYNLDNELLCGYIESENRFTLSKINKDNLQPVDDKQSIKGKIGKSIYDEEHSMAYILDIGFNRLYKYDTKSNKIEEKIYLNYKPDDMVFSVDKNEIYIINSEKEAVLTTYNVNSNTVVDTNLNISTQGKQLMERRIRMNDSDIFIMLNDEEGSIYTYDINTLAPSNKKINNSNKNKNTYDIAFTKDDTVMYSISEYYGIDRYERMENGSYARLCSVSRIFTSDYYNPLIILNDDERKVLFGRCIYWIDYSNRVETAASENIKHLSANQTILASNNKLYVENNGGYKEYSKPEGEILFITNLGDIYVRNNEKDINVININQKDVNEDGKVDNLDLISVTTKYNDSKKTNLEDINNDGIVDIYDMTILNKNM